VCDTALALLFYELLKPVAGVSLACGVLQAHACRHSNRQHSLPFRGADLLDGTHDLSVFSAAQLQEQALLCLSFHARGYTICLVFFGFACLLLGILIPDCYEN
jgi:hypothetical protein